MMTFKKQLSKAIVQAHVEADFKRSNFFPVVFG